MEVQDSSNKNVSESLQQIQDEINAGLQQINHLQKAVIIIGDTGQGKSTLLHFIAHNQLIACKKKFFKTFSLKAENPLNNIEIGDGTLSKTTRPNKWVDQDHITFYDCPGFNDTKGVEQDIINGFYIKRIFDTTEKVKILIVISENTIQGRADKFIGLLKKLENLMVNIDQFLQSVCLVLTQANMKTADEFREYLLEEFISNQSQYLSQKQQDLMQHFACGDGKIGIFRSPQSEGPIDMTESQLIRDMLDQVQFVIKPKIRITVAPDSLLALQGFGRIINATIERSCLQANRHLEKVCMKIIKSGLNYKQVIERLLKLGQSVRLVKNAKQGNRFIDNFIQLLEQLKADSKFIKSLSANTQLLVFISEIKSDTQFSHHKWISNIFVDILIEKLTQEPQIIQSTDKTILTIKCFIIGIKQLQQIIEEKGLDKVKYIHLFCIHTFYIDADLQAPGINLLIYAKFWKINENHKISLKGLNGQNYGYPAPNANGTKQNGFGLKGYKGYPGKPGQTGGSFFGKIMSQNINLGPGVLQIDVRGGNGGNGQDAGNGSNGSDGKDASQTPVIERDLKCLLNRKQIYEKPGQQKFVTLMKKIGTFNKMLVETYESKGEKGKHGGSSGQRGAGGFGGYSGVVRLDNLQANFQYGDGQCGENGKFGKPGKGGKNGKNFKGQYIKQLMLAPLREQGKQIEDKKVKTQENLVAKGILREMLHIVPLIGSSAPLAVGTLAVQGIASIISANLSDQWAYKGYSEPDGCASDGKLTEELNFKNRQEPDLPFQFRDNYARKLQQLYDCFQKELILSIGYKTNSFG